MFVSLSVNELYVDDPDKESGGKIDVSLNISLPNLHCECEYFRQPSAPASPSIRQSRWRGNGERPRPSQADGQTPDRRHESPRSFRGRV